MPITDAARKKLRQDEKRHKVNLAVKIAIRETVKKYKKGPTEKLLQEAFSKIDTGVKKNIFHINKAARMKSSLSKMIKGKKQSTAPKKSPAKKPAAKKASKKK